MKRELHVRFCEGLGVKFPLATRPAPGFGQNRKGQISPGMDLGL